MTGIGMPEKDCLFPTASPGFPVEIIVLENPAFTLITADSAYIPPSNAGMVGDIGEVETL